MVHDGLNSVAPFHQVGVLQAAIQKRQNVEAAAVKTMNDPDEVETAQKELEMLKTKSEELAAAKEQNSFRLAQQSIAEDAREAAAKQELAKAAAKALQRAVDAEEKQAPPARGVLS